MGAPDSYTGHAYGPSKISDYAAKLAPFAGGITSDHPECSDCTWVFRYALDGRYWLKFRNAWCRLHAARQNFAQPLDVLPEPSNPFATIPAEGSRMGTMVRRKAS